MKDYKKYAELRFAAISPDDIKVFYNDNGVYISVWSDYDALRPDTFIPYLGDPVPCNTSEEWCNFLSSLKFAHDRVGKDGTVFEMKGKQLFSEPLKHHVGEWKYRTNRVPELEDINE